MTELSHPLAPGEQIPPRGGSVAVREVAGDNGDPHGPPVPPAQRDSAIPRVSVVVATRDRDALLRGCLTAVVQALRECDELIVVDSASSSTRTRDVAHGAGALYLRCDEPGACRARNAGWRASSREIVAFTDDDCLPRPDWIRAVADTFARRADVDFLTGRVVPERQGRSFARLGISLFEPMSEQVLVAGDDTASLGHGANMAWRRSTLERVGGFDEALGPGTPLHAAEDHDLVWRALRAGSTGLILPGAVVTHRQWRRRTGELVTSFHYGVGSGALLVKRERSVRGTTSVDPFPRRSVLRSLAHDAGTRGGVARIAGHLRSGFEMGALAEAVKLTGVVCGAVRARTLIMGAGDRAGESAVGDSEDGHDFFNTRMSR